MKIEEISKRLNEMPMPSWWDGSSYSYSKETPGRVMVTVRVTSKAPQGWQQQLDELFQPLGYKPGRNDYLTRRYTLDLNALPRD
jgi:hypothetical protein